MKRLLYLLLCVLMSSCTRTGPDTAELKEGTWRAVLQIPGGELPFTFEVAQANDAPVVTLVNGPDRVRITEVTLSGTELTLRMPGFENRIVATLEGDRLRGTLTMIKAKGAHQQIPFAANFGDSWRFSRDAAATTSSPVNLTGRWAVTFDGNGKPSPGVGEFTQTGELVTGTFLTTTGDHRFLAGEWRDGELRLSKFDGGHVFLYRATLDANGQLQGQFWSGLAWVEAWSARRDENASIGEAENATQLKAGGQRLDFRFPDVSGANISLSDPYFRGKVVIVTLAGSWCPNCHDEAAFLAELHRQKRAAGLEIISLMFEQFGDFPQAAEAVYRFRDRYNIDYTTLIAGTSDKDDAASRLPQLNGVFAFPTTLFIDRAGVVRKIHTGFSGPATGKHYEKLVADFTSTVDTLLAEPSPRS